MYSWLIRKLIYVPGSWYTPTGTKIRLKFFFFLPILEKFEAKKNRAIILLYFIRGGY